MSPSKPLLRDYPPAAFPALLNSYGEPAYRGRQLARWLFPAGALRWETMTNLPQKLRQRLQTSFDLSGLDRRERLVAKDGTRKFLFSLRDEACIESVLIPMEQHATFCISTQVGCAMACRFCATARGGLVRQLRRGEILEQVSHLQADLTAQPVSGHGQRQFNIVFMGMGEPLDNWDEVAAAIATLTDSAGHALSPRRITLSTSGPPAGLRRFVDSNLGVGLTLSLCGASSAQRRRWMPRAGRTSLSQLLDLAASYAQRQGRPATLAYILIAGSTDTQAEAERLAQALRRRPFKINLIPFNPWEGEDPAPPLSARVLHFQRYLRDAGLQVNLRCSGGQDIGAACGQLRGHHTPSGTHT